MNKKKKVKISKKAKLKKNKKIKKVKTRMEDTFYNCNFAAAVYPLEG